MDDTKIPDWIPKYDDLPQEPQYLIEFDENDDNHIDDSQESQKSIEENVDEKSMTNIEEKDTEITLTDNIYDSALILDELQNNSIYPSEIKNKFTPSLKDIPHDILNPIEDQTAMTADDAANWPIPPWHSPDFIEPRRNETQIVVNNISKYPEMFVTNDNKDDIDIQLYKHENNQQLMSHEERVTEANIKQQKLQRQKEVNDYLTKRREPAKVRKLSLAEDDKFRIKFEIIAGVILAILYFQYRVKPHLSNYGYVGKDIQRNQRLSKLPIKYRKEGNIEHEEDLAHLTTVNDTILLKSKVNTSE